MREAICRVARPRELYMAEGRGLFAAHRGAFDLEGVQQGGLVVVDGHIALVMLL